MAKRSGSGMAGGMSPRKAMASGLSTEGNFGAEPFHELQGGIGMHPDHKMHTGMKGAMADADRGAPPAVHHTKGMHPAQAAPDHGPTHVNGYGHNMNTGKV